MAEDTRLAEDTRYSLPDLDEEQWNSILSKEDKNLVADHNNSKNNDDSARIDSLNLSTHTSSSYPNSDVEDDTTKNYFDVSEEDEAIFNMSSVFGSFDDSEETFSEMIMNGVSSTGSVLSDTFIGLVAGVGGGLVEMAEAISDGADVVTNS